MIIMAFSDKTSKILPRIFCGKFKHVAPITVLKNKMVLYQFEQPRKIVLLTIKKCDIKLLSAHGWTFVYMPHIMPNITEKKHFYTCVQLAKHMIGMKNVRTQTPNALYKKLNKKSPE